MTIMKKTQFTDARRNIRRNIVSFISILIIALLGVATFLGIGYAAASMRRNATERYQEMRFRSLEVISTLLFTQEDLDAIRSIDGVADVQPVRQAAAQLYAGEKDIDATMMTLSEGVNVPLVSEGRLPEAIGEMAVESSIAEALDLHVGDRIDMPTMLDSFGQYFRYCEEFTVTGIIIHPDHLSLTLDETPYAVVVPESFDTEEMDGCFVKAEVTLDSGLPADRFSDSYRAEVRRIADEIKATAAERTPLRDAEVKEQAYQEIEASEAETIAVFEEMRQSGDRSIEEIEKQEADFLASIAETRQEVADLAPSRWIVLDDLGSPSFVHLQAGCDNFASLQMTFALMFIVIGALVIYATVSKMIEEQRSLVGTTRALGFYQREIMAKYLIFGVSATLVGIVIGVLVARFCMEKIALDGYNRFIAVDISEPGIAVWPTAAVLISGVLLAVCAVWTACIRMVRTPATQLMQPAVPKGMTGSSAGTSHRLSLYSRLILRNIRTDLRRIIVTVVSIAGCCALIVIGVTIQRAVNGCAENQYGDIVQYDAQLNVISGCTGDYEELLREAGADYAPLLSASVVVVVDDTDAAVLFCGDVDAIGNLYHLYDWKSGEPITGAKDGVLIHRRMAEVYGLDVGSEFELGVSMSEIKTVRVAGVFENYIGLPIIMSPEYYSTVYGKEFDSESNALLVRLNGANETELLTQMEDNWSFVSWTPADADRETFAALTGTLSSVVALFIAMAAVMAGVVLMNLVNSHILQKKRELTLMRVNGFTVEETVGYILREAAATTLLGIVLGCSAGAGMGYGIVRALEQTYMQFERGVSVFAMIVGAAITLLFSAIVYTIALRKVKDLKLTDIA